MPREPDDLICRRAVQELHKEAALHPNKQSPGEAIFQLPNGRLCAVFYSCPCLFDGEDNVTLPGSLTI